MPKRHPCSSLNELISIGQTGNYPHLDSLYEKHSPGENCFLLELNWNISKYFYCLPAEDISALIKVLVESENRDFYGSASTSQIYNMFKELRRRGVEDTDELEEWAYQNTINNYVPFGSDNELRSTAKSAAEYRELKGYPSA